MYTLKAHILKNFSFSKTRKLIERNVNGLIRQVRGLIAVSVKKQRKAKSLSFDEVAERAASQLKTITPASSTLELEQYVHEKMEHSAAHSLLQIEMALHRKIRHMELLLQGQHSELA